MKPVAILGDMKQAFHQIIMRKDSRDVLRFHWVKDRDPNKVIVLRHTRATFGVGESPFILNATVKEHLSNERSNDPQSAEIIDRIEDDLYCDDLTSGDFSIAATKAIKVKSIEVFRKAGIELHKWHSNIPELENQVGTGVNQTEGETGFTKQQLGVKEAESKILGILWDKMGDLGV